MSIRGPESIQLSRATGLEPATRGFGDRLPVERPSAERTRGPASAISSRAPQSTSRTDGQALRGEIPDVRRSETLVVTNRVTGLVAPDRPRDPTSRPRIELSPHAHQRGGDHHPVAGLGVVSTLRMS